MADDALIIIEDTMREIQEDVIDVTVAEVTGNLDSFPVIGIGLSFMTRSARSVLQRKLKHDMMPDLREHTDVQIAYITALTETRGEGVHDEYAGRLLDTNPVWKMLDADEETEQQVREELIRHGREGAERIAGWVEAAGSEPLDDFAALARFLEMGGDAVANHVHDLMYYIDVLAAYQGHMDPGVYTALLQSDRVADWFLNQLITGMETGREQVVEKLRNEARS